MTEIKRHVVDLEALPRNFPTNRHEPLFWEQLGRTVATFGFLEETLAKAIFAFTATTPYSENEIQKELEKWLPKLQRALSDQLWNLIECYGKAVREHPGATIDNLEELIFHLKEAAEMRNVLCHGSWPPPDSDGASIPFFVNKKQQRFATRIDVASLVQVQDNAAELICAVVNTVTHMGWQFPGSNGPGKVIWELRK